MAEITEEMAILEEIVQIISGDDSEVSVRQHESEEQSSEAESTDSDDTATEDNAKGLDAGLQGESSGSFKLEISEDMANLKTPGNHHVSINLQHLINICTNHVQFSGKLIDLEDVN